MFHFGTHCREWNRSGSPQDGRPRIDNNALVALTLMIAASKPSEKDVMVKVILNLLG